MNGLGIFFEVNVPFDESLDLFLCTKFPSFTEIRFGIYYLVHFVIIFACLCKKCYDFRILSLSGVP
jgi:hypothetical protein